MTPDPQQAVATALRRVRGASGAGGARLYLAALLLAFALFLLRLPIFAGDTDLWYHLAAGRQIAATGEVPRTAFASFLPRPWLDYSWLFQVLAFGVHGAGGYLGLVLLRAALFLGLVAAAIAVVRPMRPPRLLRAVALTAALLVVLPRFGSVRPQLLSLLLLALALALLERGGRAVYALPVVALVWANGHGVSWPVLALVLAAYGAELVWWWWRGSGEPADDGGRRTRPLLSGLALAVAAAAVLATPHGLALLALPFESTEFAAQLLDELGPLPWRAFLSVSFSGLLPDRQTLFNIVAVLALGTLAAGAARRRVRPAHLLLAVGGALLVARGSRFVFEGVLLALPAIAAAAPAATASRPLRPRLPAGAALAGVLLLAAVPFLTLLRWSAVPGRFPFAADNLPTGVSTFLLRAGGGGTLFASPNLAGYLEWRLVPQFRIFSDLQTPFPFTDEDTFVAIAAFADPVVLGRALARHRPDYVAVPAGNPGAGAALAGEGYAAVAFDWTTVLYASRSSRGEVVAAHALVACDPFAAAAGRPGEGAEAAAGAELARLLRLDDTNAAAAVALGRLRLRGGDAASALRWAERAVALTPARGEAWHLLGDARVVAGDPAAAVAALEMAAERGAAAGPVARQLWVCWTRLGRPERAYRVLRDAVDPVAQETTHLDLLALAESALAAGELAAAERHLMFAGWKVPPADTVAVQRIAAARRRVEEARADG